MANPLKSLPKSLGYAAVILLLIAFYWLTRPLNQSESYDSINYALFAENFSFGTAPDSRNVLFHMFNRALFVASEGLGLNLGALELISFVNIICAALSLVLFARLMTKCYKVSQFAAYCGAGFLGLSYGFWRYAGAAEVYVPSIFLTLVCVTLIFGYINGERQAWLKLIAAGVLSGLAVLYYQPNLITLFMATFVLFFARTRLLAFVGYSAIGALVVLTGLVFSYATVNGNVPSAVELVEYVSSRNGEFRAPSALHTSLVKMTLAFGHDIFSAHWTRTLDPVREFLDPYIPGCTYNFNVAIHAGKGVESLAAIAAVIFLPMQFLFLRLNWISSRKWEVARVATAGRPTLFLFAWFGLTGVVVATIDPGSFEAWIPLLVPFAGIFTVLVVEPCCRMEKKKSIVGFLVLLFCYNLLCGIVIWRNHQGDYFFHRTAWIRQELTERDTVLVNEFDYRFVDYLNYYSDVQVAHLFGDDCVTTNRSHPEIHSMSLDEFLARYESGRARLFVLDDVLTPPPEFKACRSGEYKFAAAVNLADRLRARTVLVNSDEFGDTFEIVPPNSPSCFGRANSAPNASNACAP